MDVSPGHNHDGLKKAAKGAIGEQLERMVASPYLSHSKRLPNFLRFVVEHTVAGNAEKLKERTLGIKIFGREPGYDTATDPIVRVTAAELRKRMAQYYKETAHQDALRIALPPGSYVPEFHPPKGGNGFGLPEADAPSMVPAEDHTPADTRVPSHRPLTLALVLIAAAAIPGAVDAAGSCRRRQEKSRSGSQHPDHRRRTRLTED
jgi:hypothetical protein